MCPADDLEEGKLVTGVVVGFTDTDVEVTFPDDPYWADGFAKYRPDEILKKISIREAQHHQFILACDVRKEEGRVVVSYGAALENADEEGASNSGGLDARDATYAKEDRRHEFSVRDRVHVKGMNPEIVGIVIGLRNSKVAVYFPGPKIRSYLPSELQPIAHCETRVTGY